MQRLIGIFAGMMVVCAALGQDATTPPANQHAVLTVQGRGVQIYSCTETPTGAHWVFVAPAARLFDKDGVEVGTHGDGPVWHLQDGSSFLGQVIAKSPSPDEGSVPWLLVKAIDPDGRGLLHEAEFVRRSETKGGVAPVGGCDIGALTRVPYAATYTFFSSKSSG